ncbi:MAG TPA: hypothetical protein VK506_08400 [Conexibacter sp.]|nr:hypothetical protein [Conexibacter sp.]
MQTRHASKDRAAPARTAARPVAPADLAWLAAVPLALVLLAAIAFFGPPLGRLLFTPPEAGFWPFWEARRGIVPEPSERAAYLFALLAPVALAAVVALGARRPWPVAPATVRVATRVAQALVPWVLVVAIVAQHRKAFGAPWFEEPVHQVYFKLPTLAVAVLLALGLALALASARAVERVDAWTRETRAWRWVSLGAVVLLTATWVLTAVNTEESIATGHFRIFVNVPFWLDEPFAVLNGRVPLVDFQTQYGHLLAYVSAGAMALFGASLGVYTIVMTIGSGLALLAVFAVLRRVVRRSLLALALFVPVISTSFFTELGPPDTRHGPQTLFSVFPLRYLGAYALAWLTVRHLDGLAPRRRPLLFAAAGLVAINNLEFGLAAFGATLAALAIAEPAPSWARAGRLLRDAALGALAAVAAVSLLTLILSGSLPDLGMLLTFPRIYGVDAFGMMPMPHLGFHVAIYVTFAAAIVLAVVRASARASEPLLTAMLAWSGVFGLGAASYYVGRSLPEVLISIFSAWSLALALLLVATVRAILARPVRRPTLAEAAVLLAFGIAVCSIAQTPTPWSQVERIGRASADRPFEQRETTRAIGEDTRPGESVAILGPLGHRIAYDLGVDNVSPYVSIESMPLRSQMDEVIVALREAGGRKLFLSVAQTDPEQIAALRQAGFTLERTDERRNVVALVDGAGATP